jgi:phosphate starvation-inducible membrane PsiE
VLLVKQIPLHQLHAVIVVSIIIQMVCHHLDFTEMCLVSCFRLATTYLFTSWSTKRCTVSPKVWVLTDNNPVQKSNLVGDAVSYYLRLTFCAMISVQMDCQGHVRMHLTIIYCD